MTAETDNRYEAAPWLKTVSRMSSAERASWAIETQLLARGIATMRLPRGAVVGVEGLPISSLGFNGFQGPGSSLAGVSFAAHAGTVTELLVDAKLPVEPGRVCGTARRKRAARIAESMGYPVQVGPANSSKIHRLSVMVENRIELDAALESIHANTNGRNVLREKAMPTAWIQKAPSGQRLRLLVVGLSAVAAVIAPFGSVEYRQTAIDSVHPGIRELAVAALQAIPGVAHGEVHLAVEELTEEPDAQDVRILTVAVEPEIDIYQRGDDYGLTVAGLVAGYFADLSGVAQSPVDQHRETSTVFTGVVDTSRFTRRLLGRVKKAASEGVEYAVKESGPGEVTMTFNGDLGCVTMLSTVGLRGLVKGLRASTAHTEIIS